MIQLHKMLQTIEMLISKGSLAQARARLAAIERPGELSRADLLHYFHLVRRAGDFQRGARRVEKLAHLYPELELSRAYFLGELGALRQAIQIIHDSRLRLGPREATDKFLYLGNFNSLLHRYPEAITAYERMAETARGHFPVLHLVGRLNAIGHRIYMEPLPSANPCPPRRWRK
jgi:hypothetical protein